MIKTGTLEAGIPMRRFANLASLGDGNHGEASRTEIITPDLAQGTGHFRTTIAAGQALMAALRGRVSSLCLPTYVLDIPGGFGKMPLNADYAMLQADGSYLIRDFQGALHIYRDPV